MKIDLNVIRKDRIESTTGTKKMRLSADAEKWVFQTFTKSVYSNAIGTVVREIASNCFDSHKEADVSAPVLIKKTYDDTTDTYYISFVDYGVGISPDRMDNIYSVYFESSKRETNDEIGGFGLGAKTPLAYRRFTGTGDEYDNSFYVITNYDGIRYYYSIYEGSASPEFSLMHKEKTDEPNGTEVRVPMLQRDIRDFEKELVKQLYYFEDIVFEGWDESISNDYQIIRGKNFLYRGNEVDNYIHICLGRVVYPIDYGKLGLSDYDYAIPVAINVPIGKLQPVVSREKLEYSSEEDIKYIKGMIDKVMSELKQKLTDQYSNITSLEDYFAIKEDFGTLHLTDDHSIKLKGMVKQSDLDYTKYKYNALKTGESSVLFDMFFDVKMYGKRVPKNTWNDNFDRFGYSYPSLKEVKNTFCSDMPDFKAKRLKNAYLRDKYGRFYLIRKCNLEHKTAKLYDAYNIHFDTEEDFHKSATWKEILEMQEEYYEIVEKHSTVYDNVQIPDDYTVAYKQKNSIPKEMLKTTIPVKLARYRKERVSIKDLVNFRGKIFYGTTDEEDEARDYREIFNVLFKNNNLATSYSSYYAKNNGSGFGKEDSLLIITMAKNNIKYMEYCKNAMPLSMFFHKLVRRKEDVIRSQFRNQDIRQRWNDLDSFYKHTIFASLSKSWAGKVEKVRTFVDSMPKNNSDIVYKKWFFEKYMELDKVEDKPEEKIARKFLDKLETLQENNKTVLEYVKIPSSWAIVNEKTDAEMLPKILKNVLSL